jgi:stage II sporulation protein D
MVVTPLISLGSNLHLSEKLDSITDKDTDKNNSSDKDSKKKDSKDKSGEKFKVLLTNSGKVVELSEVDYICGAVASEMPASYHNEALKAQAIACYTYAVKTRESQLKNPDDKLKGAHITSDNSTHQGFKTQEELKKQWGEKYDTYYKKIKTAVESVIGRVIVYDGDLITAAYHAICSGQTENASIVWGGEVPYLTSVNSAGDKLSPDYSSTLVLTQDQFIEMAKSLEGASFEGDPATWISEAKTSDAGTVISYILGGKSFQGSKIREVFSLRSNCFTIEYKNNSFIFDIIGYGHSVGMSQYGADYMARQGSNYTEILTHYYKGTKIEKHK